MTSHPILQMAERQSRVDLTSNFGNTEAKSQVKTSLVVEPGESCYAGKELPASQNLSRYLE